MVKIAERFGSPGREHIVKTHKKPNQRSKKPASQHTGKTAKKGRTKKRQQASKPVKQHASKTTRQLTGIPVKQHTGKLTKATFYIYPEQIIDLEKLRLNHLTKKKDKTDKSALVRQAINMLVKQHTSKPATTKEV